MPLNQIYRIAKHHSDTCISKGKTHKDILGIPKQTQQWYVTMTANNLPNKVHSFNGETLIKYKQWRDDMEQVGDHVGHDDERMKRLTIDTLRGLASKNFHKYLKTNRNITWPQIRAVMNNKYCERADMEYPKQQLKGLKQHLGETRNVSRQTARPL